MINHVFNVKIRVVPPGFAEWGGVIGIVNCIGAPPLRERKVMPRRECEGLHVEVHCQVTQRLAGMLGIAFSIEVNLYIVHAGCG